MSLFVAPTRLKELLNMVYHKGQSWDLYSSVSILTIYLCIYHQILQNVICSRMTQHFIQQEKALRKFKRRYSFVLIIFQCGAMLYHMLINPVKAKSMIITTRQKHQLSDLSLRLSMDGQNIENVTEHRLLGLIVDNKFRWQAQIEHICKSISIVFLLSQLQHIINIDTRKLFYHAHIKLNIDYASAAAKYT